MCKYPSISRSNPIVRTGIINLRIEFANQLRNSFNQASSIHEHDHDHMEDPTHDHTNGQEGNRYVLLVFVVEDCVEAGVDAIA